MYLLDKLCSHGLNCRGLESWKFCFALLPQGCFCIQPMRTMSNRSCLRSSDTSGHGISTAPSSEEVALLPQLDLKEASDGVDDSSLVYNNQGAGGESCSSSPGLPPLSCTRSGVDCALGGGGNWMGRHSPCNVHNSSKSPPVLERGSSRKSPVPFLGALP